MHTHTFSKISKEKTTSSQQTKSIYDFLWLTVCIDSRHPIYPKWANPSTPMKLSYSNLLAQPYSVKVNSNKDYEVTFHYFVIKNTCMTLVL